MNMGTHLVTDTRTIKEARTEHAVHPLIKARWSARAFRAEPLTEEHIRTLVEAAAWAPSAMNDQPWRYRYALKGTAAFEALWSCLNAGNQPWAKDAGALLVSSGLKSLSRNGQPNHSWQHDVGMANANLLTQAVSMDIYGHIIGGFDHARANEVLGIDVQQEEIICFIALGHLGEAERLIEPFHTREITPRTRRPLDLTLTRLG
jgi:nitroreductase